jgi:glycosyltransferase involved in cell wall biosynthesis
MPPRLGCLPVITIAHLVGRWGFGGLEGQLAEVVDRLPVVRFRHVIVCCNGHADPMAVAADVPGNREVLRDGETGLVSPLNEAAAFGAALRRVIQSAELRRRMGQAARAHVTQNYDLNRTMEAYARAYERLARSQPVPRAG